MTTKTGTLPLDASAVVTMVDDIDYQMCLLTVKRTTYIACPVAVNADRSHILMVVPAAARAHLNVPLMATKVNILCIFEENEMVRNKHPVWAKYEGCACGTRGLQRVRSADHARA